MRHQWTIWLLAGCLAFAAACRATPKKLDTAFGGGGYGTAGRGAARPPKHPPPPPSSSPVAVSNKSSQPLPDGSPDNAAASVAESPSEPTKPSQPSTPADKTPAPTPAQALQSNDGLVIAPNDSRANVPLPVPAQAPSSQTAGKPTPIHPDITGSTGSTNSTVHTIPFPENLFGYSKPCRRKPARGYSESGSTADDHKPTCGDITIFQPSFNSRAGESAGNTPKQVISCPATDSIPAVNTGKPVAVGVPSSRAKSLPAAGQQPVAVRVDPWLQQVANDEGWREAELDRQNAEVKARAVESENIRRVLEQFLSLGQERRHD